CKQSEWKNNTELTPRCGVFFIFTAPDGAVTLGQFYFRCHGSLCFFHGSGQIASFDRILHANIARIVFAIDERGAANNSNLSEFFQRNLLSASSRNQNISNLLRCFAEPWLQANNKIK